jgi:DNA-binding HxlR family transcriptional regulator
MQKDTKAGPTDCPMTRLMSAISSKWSMPVLYNLLLAEGPVRFGALKKSIGHVTQRELSHTLKKFVDMGVVIRNAYAEVPPRVEYSLTPLGRSLNEPVMALSHWAEKHAHQLVAAGARQPAAAQRGKSGR